VIVGVMSTITMRDAAAAMAVFDASNYTQAIAQVTKLTDQLNTLRETYNKVTGIMNLIGQVQSMARDFQRNPLRLATQFSRCLSANVGDAGSLCGARAQIDQSLFAPAGAGMSDSATKAILDARAVQMRDATARGVAIGTQYRRDAATQANDLLTLAAEAQSVGTMADQLNMTNKIMLQIASQQQLNNALLASLVEATSSAQVMAVPVAVGTSRNRIGVE